MHIDIPFYKQDTLYTCGPVALQMVMSFLGHFKSEGALADEAHTDKIKGTSHEGMIDTVRKEGFYCYVNSRSSINEIKHFIHLGLPVIVDFIEPAGDDGHYAVVTGFVGHNLILNDSLNGEGRHMSLQDFTSRWHDFLTRSHGWMMVLSKTDFQLGKQYLPR